VIHCDCRSQNVSHQPNPPAYHLVGLFLSGGGRAFFIALLLLSAKRLPWGNLLPFSKVLFGFQQQFFHCLETRFRKIRITFLTKESFGKV
jgi:hypothetical protein